MELVIKYEDGEGNITERRISEIEPEPPSAISAFCHLRRSRRIFVVKRILSAVDLSTSSQLGDLYDYFGLLPQDDYKVNKREFGPTVTPRTLGHSIEEYKEERKKEKDFLFSRFVHPAAIDLYKKKFFALFHNQCFKCGSKKFLDIDHHIPMKLGGHLVPGNLVALCKKCNNKKRDSHPNKFYSQRELSKLEPLLKMQVNFFNFKFDWSSWRKDPKAYLLTLGVNPDMVNEV